MLRPRRVAFMLYAIALIVGTHWPALDMSPDPSAPAADKLIHFYAYLGATILLWWSGWVRRGAVLAAIVAIWVVIDEVSQMLPFLERTFAPLDVIASLVGIAVGMAWGYAFRPLGGEHNRMRLRGQQFVLDHLFTKPVSWLLLIVAAAPCAWALIRIWPFVEARLPDPRAAWLYGGAHLVWLGAIGLIWWSVWQRGVRRFFEEKPCLSCGYPCGDLNVDNSGNGRCERCGIAVHIGQWLEPVPPSGAMQRRMFAHGALAFFLTGFILVLLLVVAFIVARAIGPHAESWLSRARLPADMRTALYLSALLMCLAVAVDVYRRMLARYVDQQGNVCRRCGHDLRATPTERGIGICGECGTPFAALSEHDATQTASGENHPGAA